VLVFAVPASPLAQPWPVIGGSLLSATIGLACHALIGEPLMAAACATGHPWPHHPVPARAAPRLPYAIEDLDAVLEDWDEVLDVSREDLDALVRAVEARVLARNDEG
jgi:CBS-domain-containing membrane protein